MKQISVPTLTLALSNRAAPSTAIILASARHPHCIQHRHARFTGECDGQGGQTRRSGDRLRVECKNTDRITSAFSPHTRSGSKKCAVSAGPMCPCSS